jgi:hypothetical protein
MPVLSRLTAGAQTFPLGREGADNEAIYMCVCVYIRTQGVPRVKVTTSGECSLRQTIPI